MKARNGSNSIKRLFSSSPDTVRQTAVTFHNNNKNNNNNYVNINDNHNNNNNYTNNNNS